MYPEMTLLIDYAHNAMSLESLLKTLRKYHPKRLICLFGCGGNRARDRRFQMGEVSGRLADLTVMRNHRRFWTISGRESGKQKALSLRLQTVRRRSGM